MTMEINCTVLFTFVYIYNSALQEVHKYIRINSEITELVRFITRCMGKFLTANQGPDQNELHLFILFLTLIVTRSEPLHSFLYFVTPHLLDFSFSKNWKKNKDREVQ